MSVARGGGLNFGEQVREVGITPLSTNRFTETRPKELGRAAREEDVISILNRGTQGAHSITRTMALEDLHAGREAAADPLPQKDPNLKWEANVPDKAEGLRS